jgi:DHA1 family bicyclomycin/chloramphenicol resistance-like MFS transporter
VIKKIPFTEFIILMALLMSLPALAIDSVLPALPLMKDALGVSADNQIQFVIGILFLGLILGQLILGPVSDSFGRKNGIFIGLAIFVLGSILSMLAPNFETMLAGRFLQGIGAAASRVICVAIARDLYHGRDMARIMSYIMAVFIFVPVIAPIIGQGVLLISHWRTLFALYMLVAFIAIYWMSKRLPETLSEENRKDFTFSVIKADIWIVLSNKITMGYTYCSGLIFGAFTGYLMSAQQIFQDFYDVGDMFSLYFGLSALSIGFASVVNGKIVKHMGQRRICHYALIGTIVTAAVFLITYDLSDPQTPLLSYMIFASTIFFFNGMLFGNLNSLAMEPMGKQAGMASAISGSVATAIAVVSGTIIGQSYDHTLTPLVYGFLVLSTLAFILHLLLDKAMKKAEAAIVAPA